MFMVGLVTGKLKSQLLPLQPIRRVLELTKVNPEGAVVKAPNELLITITT